MLSLIRYTHPSALIKGESFHSSYFICQINCYIIIISTSTIFYLSMAPIILALFLIIALIGEDFHSFIFRVISCVRFNA